MTHFRSFAAFALLALTVESAFAQRGDKGREAQPDLFPIDKVPPSPVLSPDEALRTFKIEPGFRIELVASEPLIGDPVVMRFDEDGRLWVVELRGYMPNLEGKGEDALVGRIVILEDTDGDGRMDKSKVFLDGLNQARAIALVKGGILYCEPPKLWFIEKDENDKPGNKILIDANYAGGGNVEHKPNGLMPALDNWLYNAKSNKRYRFHGNAWVKEETEGRGQWGINQDDYGRLFYNTNSSGLRGDSVPPSALMRNPNFRSKEGTNRGIGSNRVHPIRPNTGINRGYRGGMLDEEGKLRSFTGASGPCIYRGDQFPEEYYGNGFTPEPTGNLVKRFLIEEKDGQIGGKDAFADRDFLASTDERFRPVSMENGPDGCLYIADMYRGIIQHRTYVTSYLRRQILHRGLDKPIGLGRIYRIVSEKKKRQIAPKMSKMAGGELAGQLKSDNGWVRDTAQRLLIECADDAAESSLKKLVGESSHPLAQIHALWALEGMQKLDGESVATAVRNMNHSKLAVSAIRVSETLAGDRRAEGIFLPEFQKLELADQHDVQIQMALSLGRFDDPRALLMLRDLVATHGKSRLIRDAALSGLSGNEEKFAKLLKAADLDPSGMRKLLAETAAKASRFTRSETHLKGKELAAFNRGKTAYSKTCFACHGNDGEGMIPLGPPLVKSEWATGEVETLAHIVLNGVQGPIKVRGKLYAPPEIQPLMPGLGATSEYDDKDLADIMTYVRNAWGNKASVVLEKHVLAARKTAKEGIYTPEELLEEKKKK